MTSPYQCVYCNNDFERFDLRPYGPGGGLVCCDCVTSDPKRDAEARSMYHTLLAAALATDPEVVILTENGPIPHNPQAATLH